MVGSRVKLWKNRKTSTATFGCDFCAVMVSSTQLRSRWTHEEEMAPKKKPNRTSNNHQPLEPGPFLEGSVSEVNLEKEHTGSSSKNHILNGHIVTGKHIVENVAVHVNGCNGTHLSDSSESSSSNNHTSSPEEYSKLEESSSSVEVIGACLNQISIGSGPSDLLPGENSDGHATHQNPTSQLVEKVTYVQYQSELQMPDIMRLIQKDLSEPYSIYTYRYFIHNWPMLCFLVSITTNF